MLSRPRSEPAHARGRRLWDPGGEVLSRNSPSQRSPKGMIGKKSYPGACMGEKVPVIRLFGSMSGYRMKNGEDLWRAIRQGLQGQRLG